MSQAIVAALFAFGACGAATRRCQSAVDLAACLMLVECAVIGVAHVGIDRGWMTSAGLPPVAIATLVSGGVGVLMARRVTRQGNAADSNTCGDEPPRQE